MAQITLDTDVLDLESLMALAHTMRGFSGREGNEPDHATERATRVVEDAFYERPMTGPDDLLIKLVALHEHDIKSTPWGVQLYRDASEFLPTAAADRVTIRLKLLSIVAEWMDRAETARPSR